MFALRFLCCLVALAPITYGAGLADATDTKKPAAATTEKKVSLKEAQAEFAKADRELNAAWAALKKATPELEFKPIQEDQRTWLSYRDEVALFNATGGPNREAEEKARQTPDYLTSAAAVTRDRVQWLQRLLKPLDYSPVTGVWGDSYGGTMELVEQGTKLYFRISVVRGPTAHLGEISGIAHWNEPIGWFSDKGLDKTKEEETNLAFVLRNQRLQITGAKTSHYHGARAYFDGEYMKLENLNPAAQKKVIQEAQEASKPE